MARTRQKRNDRPKASALSDSDKVVTGISRISQQETAIAKAGPTAPIAGETAKFSGPGRHDAGVAQRAAAGGGSYVPAVASIVGEPAGAWPSTAQATDFQFFIDAVSDKQIEGWIFRTKQPSHRCVVLLKEGDRILARAIASRFRVDLAMSGIGDGHHSFVIATPPGLQDGEEHLLDIVEEDSGIRLARERILWRAGQAVARRAIDEKAYDEKTAGAIEPPAARATDFRFFIDGISDKQIEGWIIRTGQPLHRCVVVLREGDHTLARATASLFRADLTTAGIGDGHHSFVMPTPPGLRDGEEHLLDIVEEESGIRLTREPIRWRAERGATQRVINSIGTELGRQTSPEALSGLTSAQPDPGAPHPFVPVEEPVTGTASDASAPIPVGTQSLLETKDFRSLVAFYTREITFQLARSRHRSEN